MTPLIHDSEAEHLALQAFRTERYIAATPAERQRLDAYLSRIDSRAHRAERLAAMREALQEPGALCDPFGQSAGQWLHDDAEGRALLAALIQEGRYERAGKALEEILNAGAARDAGAMAVAMIDLQEGA